VSKTKVNLASGAQNMSRRHQAISFSRYILPMEDRVDQLFWDERWPIIQTLSHVEPVLDERRHFFEKSRSRNHALSLVLMLDLAWQVVRKLAGLSGKESLPPPSEQFNWVYDLHTKLRHPEELYPQHAWMFHDPWPQHEADRLIEVAKNMEAVLVDITGDFELGTGYVGEIEEKQIRASIAEMNSLKRK
jgi:hypothetical protein